MLEGPDLEEVKRIAAVVRGRFLYSGGIGQLADLEALAELRQVNLAGVIAGKALYEGRFTVAEAQAALAASASDVHLKRVIPCLDVDAGRVVKGTNFVDLRDAGDPVELAASYDAEGADELVFLDITATLEQARHDRRARAAHRRRRVHPVHDRRRHPLGRRRPGACSTPAPTRCR